MTTTRCGVAVVLGVPNSGKSTLINQLAGAKVSIVTHKVQTTRARLRAIAMHGDSQIILVDTPGIFEPKRALDEAMVDAAWSGAGDADEVVLLADARNGLDDAVQKIIEGLEKSNAQAVLALNKIDLMKREKLLAAVKAFNERFAFKSTFLVSALTGDGVADLKDHLARAMPAGPWLYPEDQLADFPERLLAAEITREQIYLRLHQELPYASTVETENWQIRKDGSIRIEQVIYVERDSQKKIVLGKSGRTIKQIGQTARAGIAEALGKTVHLFLFVKVRENWSNDPERLRNMGLEL